VHLDLCVAHWKALGHEFAQLSGTQRDGLVRLLEGRKPQVDRVTDFLSQARKSGGMAPEKHKKVRDLQEQRDRAREKYERLRAKYIEAERDHQAAERQKQLKAATAEHQEKKAPVPNLASLQAQAARKGPILVRLPDPKAADKAAQAKLPQAQAKPLPPPKPPVIKAPSIKAGALQKEAEAEKTGEQGKKKAADKKGQEAKKAAAPPPHTPPP